MPKTSPSASKRVILTRTEKLEFVRKAVSWIHGRDIIETCFVLNFGYEDSLPWPQVHSLFCFSKMEHSCQLSDVHRNFTKNEILVYPIMPGVHI